MIPKWDNFKDVHFSQMTVSLLKTECEVIEYELQVSKQTHLVFILIFPHLSVCSHYIMSNSCDPMHCSLPGSFYHGIFQARILGWAAISFSKESPQPRDWAWPPALQADSLESVLPGKLCFKLVNPPIIFNPLFSISSRNMLYWSYLISLRSLI